ncbi:hypothetical protein [Streptomyces sp. 2A115]|uniref:hypothetical protein n=1 Tax=Streptomyces sp. 2A115 TaxID=3457439 RepID=UPI003FD107C8
MDRTPLPPHALARQPLATIATVVSLAAFLAVPAAFGGAALGVFFVLWIAGLLFYGVHAGQKQLREVERDRARSRKSHAASMADRMLRAQREGYEFEDSSAELAEGFGRIPQEVTDHLTEENQVIARHAADLVAEGVLRMRLSDFHVTVFDLEVINYEDVAELKKRCRYGRAAEASKDYLTVCVVTLPMPLPYVAAAHLFGEGRKGADRTLDPEFADFLLSVPAVREAAMNAEQPWSVEQDRLIACAWTNSGLDTPAALSLASRMAALAGEFPWAELDRFRLAEPEPRHQYTLWASLGPQPVEPAVGLVQRWEEAQIGRTDLRAYKPNDEWLDFQAAAEQPSA